MRKRIWKCFDMLVIFSDEDSDLEDFMVQGQIDLASIEVFRQVCPEDIPGGFILPPGYEGSEDIDWEDWTYAITESGTGYALHYPYFKFVLLMRDIDATSCEATPDTYNTGPI